MSAPPTVGTVYCFPSNPFHWLVCASVEDTHSPEVYVASFMYDGGERFRGAILVEYHTARSCEALAEVAEGDARDALIAKVEQHRAGLPAASNDGVSRYYRQHEHRASALWNELHQAKACGASAAEVKRIERALESAQYVGD